MLVQVDVKQECGYHAGQNVFLLLCVKIYKFKQLYKGRF